MSIGYNGDLTTEILLRLPVKSILRFKTVSKQWLSIVSSGRFRQIHAASGAATANTRLFFTTDTTLEFLSLDKHTYPMPNSDKSIKILSSSGGLLLLLRSKSRCRDYSIWNPTTNEIKSLAAAVPHFIKKSRSVAAYLAFDPTESLHYKVLFVYRCKNSLLNESFQSMIYSSETRTFKSLQTVFIDLPCMGIYWNDAIHWISSNQMGSFTKFTYFDFSKECTNVHRFPPRVSAMDSNLYISEYQGNLLAITRQSHFCRLENDIYRVFELSKRDYDYSGWTLKYKVDIGFGMQYQQHPSMPIPSYYQFLSFDEKDLSIIPIDFRFIGILGDDEQDLSIVFALTDNTFVACNLKNNLKKKLGTYANWSDCSIVYQYKETLACVSQLE